MESSKKYDVEERTYVFAKSCRVFVKKIQKSINTLEDGRQLIRSSGSIAANYIEANESLGKKDMVMRMRISKK